jgi:hypothetical protein
MVMPESRGDEAWVGVRGRRRAAETQLKGLLRRTYIVSL